MRPARSLARVVARSSRAGSGRRTALRALSASPPLVERGEPRRYLVPPGPVRFTGGMKTDTIRTVAWDPRAEVRAFFAHLFERAFLPFAPLSLSVPVEISRREEAVRAASVDPAPLGPEQERLS
ncbi:hypothetical protein QFZ53_000374 [Microbacterium natoriense]|uniref:Uncharacterized protein n=2 Tax=Microbacterium natoriense TaxID=284570 RepID=A0AAW8ESG3_9MICO|nr:hypothetical protein [Microbacterium natoriense]